MKLWAPDDYEGVRKWTLNFYPDDKEAVKDSGLALRYDTKTNSYIRPRRDLEKKIKDEIVHFEAPTVLDESGRIWDPEVLGYPGNGSRVEITLSVFDTRMKIKGHRLEKVRILKNIPYERELTESQKEEAKVEPSLTKSETSIAPTIVTPKRKMPF